MRQVKTLIIDLDNTIFDWFEFWFNSFDPIYQAIHEKGIISETELQSEIRKIHQKRRTSEYPFLLDELPFLKEKYEGQNVRDVFSDAIQSSQKGRDEATKLYPTVFESLWKIKQQGTKIVAYTESLGFYSAYRLKRFGLDGVIDVMFCPKDHALPKGISEKKLRRLPDDFYKLEITDVEYTPLGELKPNPKLLLDIIDHVGADRSSTVYVGDGLYKDIIMAQNANIYDIFAKYGVSQTKPEYEILRKISHWTDADVQREKDVVEQTTTKVAPTATLEKNFNEIFNFCNFISFEDDDLALTMRAWEKTVDVQQHFNDMGMRIRSFSITLLGVLLTATGYVFSENLVLTISKFSVSASVIVVVAALLFWLMFFLMDRFWYHILLKGAVNHGMKIEGNNCNNLPMISLGKSISEASQNVKFCGFKLNSTNRLNIFYSLGFFGLTILGLALFFSTVEIDPSPRSETIAVEMELPGNSISKPKTSQDK